MTITVYSKPACVQCDSTYRALLIAGVNDFEVVSMQDDQTLIDYVMKLGHRQAPVVIVGEDHWSGYRPDQIKALVSRLIEQGVKLTPRHPLKDREEINAMIKDIKSKVSKAVLATA
jgi:Glutaredoxin and related proteins